MTHSLPPLFFLHIPRTGGTTVDTILSRQFPKEHILKIYSKEEYTNNRYLEYDFVNQLEYITGHLLLDTYDPPTIYAHPVRVITFLREPVQRLHSEYIFYKTWPKQHLYQYLHEHHVSFQEYLTSRETLIKYRGKNFMTRCISGKSFSIEKKPLAALAFAKRQLEKNFFFFGLTERFTESVFLLSRQIPLQYIVHDKHNKLSTKVKAPLSDEDRAVAMELNTADSELFCFACELFQERIANLGSEQQAELKKFLLVNQKFQKVSAMLRAEEGNSDGAISLPKDTQ